MTFAPKLLRVKGRASLVPSPVLNAVVTVMDAFFAFGQIPFRRVPLLRDSGRWLWKRRHSHGSEAG
jgi:hypothetical protein